MSEEVSETLEKPPITDEERLALAKRLDSELDDFINGLEKKPYTDGWSEDNWREEMENHPFFMTGAGKKGEVSPLAEGLAKLKYDPNENSPKELALNYKEDGNFNFKHKNYRLAILGYTEGLKARCDDPETDASLYNNRAASQWELKNYRSCLLDSEKALSLKPDHKKARIRAAKAGDKISRFDICIKHCEEHLKTAPDDKEILSLLQSCKKSKIDTERDKRKKDRTERVKNDELNKILDVIKSRGIKIANQEHGEELNLAKLEPNLPGALDSRVHLEDDILRWPILLLYPEFGTTDFIRNCPENVSLANQLEQLFPAPWDEDGKYRVSGIHVYFEGWDKKAHKVDPGKNLGDLLVERYFVLKAGTPAFFIIVRGSSAEKRFLDIY